FKVAAVPANYKCNSVDLKSCEVGDLSGKWGNVNMTSPSFSYLDPTLSMEDAGANNSIIGLSVVIHRADKSRLACANITVLASGQVDDKKSDASGKVDDKKSDASGKVDDKKSDASSSNLQLGSWLTLTAFLASVSFL
ncbi:Cell surface superoxide dismutase [Cu-Zn] 4, partial [Basidiobolus ranarum]